MRKTASEKKRKLVDEFIKKPLKAGDRVYVAREALGRATKEQHNQELCDVVKVNKKSLVVSDEGTNYKIKTSDIVSRFSMYVGANPFNEALDHTRSLSFPLSSILSSLGVIDRDRDERYKINGVFVRRCNWNPYIYKDGKKFYYQRDFVWGVRDKQLLVESIYQNIDCGKILVRKRSWKELESAKNEKELAFNDLVDGKQRLGAIKSFIDNEFQDFHGNYYSDLSDYAQMKFVEHQLFSYSEMPEDSKDNDVINQFLKLNFTGVPQSEEHIEYVKTLKL